MKPEKFKITFVVPGELQKDLRKEVVNAGYGLRGKSKWVAEAIDMLFQMNNYSDLVNYGDELKGFEKVETVIVDKGFKKRLEDAIIEIRRNYPMLEGVQSRIVRSAIVQRLLRS